MDNPINKHKLPTAKMEPHLNPVFQNETRNRIIRMNLFMEMCMLGVTFGACVGSIFGMNLNSGIEDHPYAFFLVTSFLILGSVFIIFFFLRRFSKITDSGKAKNYPVLKDFFKYVDTIELLRFNNEKRALTKAEFSDLLMRVVSREVTREEVELIFPLFEEDRDQVKPDEVSGKPYLEVRIDSTEYLRFKPRLCLNRHHC